MAGQGIRLASRCDGRWHRSASESALAGLVDKAGRGILTLMSVWWEEGRKQLEIFARDARLRPQGPSSSG